MSNIAFIIVGRPETTNGIANHILGEEVFSSDKKPKKGETPSQMKSTSDKKTIVFKTSHRIKKEELLNTIVDAFTVAHKVVVLVTINATSPAACETYLEAIFDRDPGRFLMICSQHKQSLKEKENQKLRELETKFKGKFMEICLDLEKEELKEKYTELIAKAIDDDELTPQKPCEDKAAAVYIAIVGSPGSGKSSTGNLLLGEDVFETDLYDDKKVMKDCKEVKIKDKQNEMYIVDTPGEMDPASVKKYLDILVKKKAARYTLLLTMNIGTRMSPAEQVRISQMKSAFGDSFIKDHLHVAFTRGDQIKILQRQRQVWSFETFVRSHTGPLGDLLNLCNYRCVLVNNCEESREKEKESVAKIFNMILHS